MIDIQKLSTINLLDLDLFQENNYFTLLPEDLTFYIEDNQFLILGYYEEKNPLLDYWRNEPRNPTESHRLEIYL